MCRKWISLCTRSCLHSQIGFFNWLSCNAHHPHPPVGWDPQELLPIPQRPIGVQLHRSGRRRPVARLTRRTPRGSKRRLNNCWEINAVIFCSKWSLSHAFVDFWDIAIAVAVSKVHVFVYIYCFLVLKFFIARLCYQFREIFSSAIAVYGSWLTFGQRSHTEINEFQA